MSDSHDRTVDTVVGVDACPSGWLATVIDGETVTVERHRTFRRLHDSYPAADRILVDIPVGLPTDERRRCDASAKGLLGCRGGSVFYAPSEPAIACAAYEDAKQAHREATGNGLMQQAYNLREKILEVRALVDGDYGGLVRESHPELCFAGLNGQPIAYPKSSAAGRELRLQCLQSELDGARALYDDAETRYLRKDVRRDDILDAMCLAAVGRHPLVTTPPDPATTEPRIYYPEFELASLMRTR